MAARIETLFVLDPFRTVRIDRDTTYAFMREAQKRGHGVLACRISDLFAHGPRSWAHAKRVGVHDDPLRPFSIESRVDVPLHDCQVVFMRKDPPFDSRYIFATYLLDGVDPAQTLVVNRPAGLREANEKCFILRFPELIPETLVTTQASDIIEFLCQQQAPVVVKPLDGAGGSGVFLLREDDPNLGSLLEAATHFGTSHTMCQRYLPAARDGDKRILLIDGEPVGATLRVPKPGELRGNIHVGATCVKSELTARDRAICGTLAPALREHGLYFVGIDVIGDYLTEVNVTSPTGVHQINRLNGDCVEARMWDWVEGRLSAR